MDILSIILTFLSLTFFGLLIAFNPLLLVSQLAIILKSKRPVFNAAIFALGVISPIIILGLIGEFIISSESNVRAIDVKITLGPRLDILIGLLFLLVAVKTALNTKIRKPKKNRFGKSIAIMEQASSSPGYLFIFAFVRSAVSATSIIGILASVKSIKALSDNPIVIIIGLSWTLLVGISPFLALIGYSLKEPSRLQDINQRIGPAISRNYRSLIIWMCMLFSIYFLYQGIF